MKSRLDLFRCQRCGHVTKTEWNRTQLLANLAEIDFRAPSTPVTWLLKRLPEAVASARRLAVLDVGCWDGRLLADMPSDWRRVGIEPNSEAADAARARGIEVVGGAVEDVSLGEDEYDLITMIDVLEHLVASRDTLAKLAAALKPGGMLLALTGNAGSASARLWGPGWYYFNYPEHVQFFTKESFRRGVERAGLKPVAAQRVQHPKIGRAHV